MPALKPLVLGPDGATVAQLGVGDTLREDALPPVPNWVKPPGLNCWINPVRGSLAAVALTLNTLYLWPVILPAMTLQSIQLEVTTLGTSGLLRAGFYANDPNFNQPELSGLLADLGTQSSATVGAKTYATSLVWPGGILWYAVVSQTTACSIRVMNSGSAIALPFPVGDTPGTNNARFGLAVTGVTGALPTSGTWTSNSNPDAKLFVRRSAT